VVLRTLAKSAWFEGRVALQGAGRLCQTQGNRLSERASNDADIDSSRIVRARDLALDLAPGENAKLEDYFRRWNVSR